MHSILKSHDCDYDFDHSNTVVHDKRTSNNNNKSLHSILKSNNCDHYNDDVRNERLVFIKNDNDDDNDDNDNDKDFIVCDKH